jgi:endonuclease G
MMRIIINLALAVIFANSLAFAGPLEDCQEYAKFGVPGRDGDILCRKGYLLAHSPDKKTPIWVIEHLTAEKATGSLHRTDNFQPDPDLPKGKRAELSDYKKSGYDQGHMAPAADMAWDEQAMRESFYLSNMVPQVGIGMNRGIWKDLEEKIRGWALERGEIYIYTGPIFSSNIELGEIGKNKVAVPNQLYKVVFDPVKIEAIAFIMPNKALKSNYMPQYIVSIREVEKATGLDFLSHVDKLVQDVIETKRAVELWN